MPVDDEEHQPCRQMAAVLIERTIYDESYARPAFEKATRSALNQPKCANHPKSCACQMALEGWKHPGNEEQVELLKGFYQAHYDREKDEGYLQAVRDIAHRYGITFEEMLEKERAQKAEWEAADERAAAREKAHRDGQPVPPDAIV
jgi:protein-disulfide isomerase-like protein with CxxC motif